VSHNSRHQNDAQELITGRLALPLITAEDVAAVIRGPRPTSWAPDFPADGDRVIARLLMRIGAPGGPGALFGHRLVRERASGLVVGGVGFFGPPEEGRVEIGYGIVASRRRRGYATEAVLAMLELAFAQPGVSEVIAAADPRNTASIRVLEKSGLLDQSPRGEEHRYSITSQR
jgi:RimJ/RimL family protein N-acetyltransferase